jgi:hypothetical protein
MLSCSPADQSAPDAWCGNGRQSTFAVQQQMLPPRAGAFELPISRLSAYVAAPVAPRFVHVSSAGVTRPNRPGINVDMVGVLSCLCWLASRLGVLSCLCWSASRLPLSMMTAACFLHAV